MIFNIMNIYTLTLTLITLLVILYLYCKYKDNDDKINIFELILVGLLIGITSFDIIYNLKTDYSETSIILF